MNRLVSATFLAMLISAGLFSCGRTASSASTKPSVTHVNIVNHKGSDEFVFQQKTIRVHAGTRVVWINKSVQPHTVTAKGEYPAFNSGTIKLIKPGHQYSFVFRHAGRYPYFCLLHPYMTATVIVQS